MCRISQRTQLQRRAERGGQSKSYCSHHKSNIEIWFVDGTFKTAPKIFAQIFTIINLQEYTGHSEEVVVVKALENPSTDIRHFLSLLFVNKALSIRFKAPIRFLLKFIYFLSVFIKIFAFTFYLFSQYILLICINACQRGNIE